MVIRTGLLSSGHPFPRAAIGRNYAGEVAAQEGLLPAGDLISGRIRNGARHNDETSARGRQNSAGSFSIGKPVPGPETSTGWCEAEAPSTQGAGRW
jgi:hypothetical protein